MESPRHLGLGEFGLLFRAAVGLWMVFPEREQDLSVCEAADQHLGNLLDAFFPMQRDEMRALE